MPGVRMGIKKENRGILSKSLSNGKGVDRRIMTELDANKKAEELLKGAYDLHVHSSPSVFPRELDGFQLIREADAAGMAGVMLKSHYESTALRAELINRYSGCKAKAYGGLCLNCPAGGKKLSVFFTGQQNDGNLILHLHIQAKRGVIHRKIKGEKEKGKYILYGGGHTDSGGTPVERTGRFIYRGQYVTASGL